MSLDFVVLPSDCSDSEYYVICTVFSGILLRPSHDGGGITQIWQILWYHVIYISLTQLNSL